MDRGLEVSEAIAEVYGPDAVQDGDCVAVVTEGKRTAVGLYLPAVMRAMTDYRCQVAG